MKSVLAAIVVLSCLVGETSAAAPRFKQVTTSRTVTRGSLAQAPVLQQSFRQRSFSTGYGVAAQASFAPAYQYQMQAQFVPAYQQAQVLMQAPVYVQQQAPVLLEQAPVYVQQIPTPVLLQPAAPVYQCPAAASGLGQGCGAVPGASLQTFRQRSVYR